MNTIHLPVCVACDAPIREARDGIIIQGNIYVATVTKDGRAIGGLIGGAEGMDKPLKDVEPVAYCKKCFIGTAFGGRA